MGYLKAIFWDLGDSIMQETTEEKIDGVTQRAELIPGIADVIATLHARNIPLAIVADTRTGTCTNVLNQHGLSDYFPVRAISDELGVVKPHPIMFESALNDLGIEEADRNRVVMVGNNLARDIKGAKALGLIAVWFHWNERYPTTPSDPLEVPNYEVTDAAQLLDKLIKLDSQQI